MKMTWREDRGVWLEHLREALCFVWGLLITASVQSSLSPTEPLLPHTPSATFSVTGQLLHQTLGSALWITIIFPPSTWQRPASYSLMSHCWGRAKIQKSFFCVFALISQLCCVNVLHGRCYLRGCCVGVASASLSSFLTDISYSSNGRKNSVPPDVQINGVF